MLDEDGRMILKLGAQSVRESIQWLNQEPGSLTVELNDSQCTVTLRVEDEQNEEEYTLPKKTSKPIV